MVGGIGVPPVTFLSRNKGKKVYESSYESSNGNANNESNERGMGQRRPPGRHFFVGQTFLSVLPPFTGGTKRGCF